MPIFPYREFRIFRSPSWIIASRLIGGIGNVAAVGVSADVCRATTLEERTPILVGFGIARQLGLLFGPACNLFLRAMDFYMGPLRVNKLNAPGLFLAALYLILEVMAAAFYYDLARSLQFERDRERAAAAAANEGAEVSSTDEGQPEDDNQRPLLNPDVGWVEYKNEMLRPEIIALMFLRFIGFFGQTCLEARD